MATSTHPFPATMEGDIGQALGTDYFLIRSELAPADLDYLQRTRDFVESEVLPTINQYWQNEELPIDLIRSLTEAAAPRQQGPPPSTPADR